MKRSSSWIAVLPSLIIPICVGLMMYVGMLALIQHDVITNETVLRYLTGHPVSKITMAMFFIGTASLLMIGSNVFEQFGAEKKIRLDSSFENLSDEARDAAANDLGNAIGSEAANDTGSDDHSVGENEPVTLADNNSPVVDHAIGCGQQLLDLPHWIHEHYLWQRIVNALHSIYRTGTTAGVEEELKYLADIDLDRQQQRYSLVQILIWATPMLGFLGTVLGISQALGGINVGPENDFQQMMNGLRGSLYVAFDTTALALTLSMVLMFGQFLIDRFESQLLHLCDQRARSEIAGQFDLSQERDAVNEQIGREMVEAMKSAVQSQTEVWRKTVLAAQQAWASTLGDMSGQIQEHLSIALDESVSNLAHYLGESISRADDSMSHRWEQWQVTLSDNARQLANHQSQLVEQTDLIQKLIAQTNDESLFEPVITKNQEAIDETNRLRESLDDLTEAVAMISGTVEKQTPLEIYAPRDRAKIEPKTDLETGHDQKLKRPESIPEIVLPETNRKSKRQIVEIDLNRSGAVKSVPATEFAARDHDISDHGLNGSESTTDSIPRSSVRPEIVLPFSKKAA